MGAVVAEFAVEEVAGGAGVVGKRRGRCGGERVCSGARRRRKPNIGDQAKLADGSAAEKARENENVAAVGGGRAWQSRGKIAGGDAGVDGERSRCHCARRATPVRTASSAIGGRIASAVGGGRRNGGRPRAAAPVELKQK